jgi:hypothetical protein
VWIGPPAVLGVLRNWLGFRTTLICWPSANPPGSDISFGIIARAQFKGGENDVDILYYNCCIGAAQAGHLDAGAAQAGYS